MLNWSRAKRGPEKVGKAKGALNRPKIHITTNWLKSSCRFPCEILETGPERYALRNS